MAGYTFNLSSKYIGLTGCDIGDKTVEPKD